MRAISILIPTYNEAENVKALSAAIISEMEKLPEYGYEIIFIDNDSRDSTRDIIRRLAGEDKGIVRRL